MSFKTALVSAVVYGKAKSSEVGWKVKWGEVKPAPEVVLQ